MYSILEKDSVAYGIYAGCIEVLLVLVLYISQGIVSKFVGDNSLQVYNTMVFLLPLVTLAVYIKKSAVQAKKSNSHITGYELFTSGYTTGIVATLSFACMLWLAEFALLLMKKDFSNFTNDLFSLTYNYIVVIGLGITISIILSYFAYYLVSHFDQITYPSSYRRLPAPKKNKIQS
jgi:hypothetical protein